MPNPSVRGRVLVVDDEPDVRDAVETALGGLLARVRALRRRPRPAGEDAPLWFAGLSLDPTTREVRRDERRVELTRTEYALLELFLRNPRQVLTRDVIMERV